MVSEVDSIANGQGSHSNIDEAQLVNQAARGRNRAQRARGQPSINKNAHRNASNLANPSPSQGGNAENAGANRGVDDYNNQIAAVITQMATMFIQVNGMPIPPAVQQLGVKIPSFKVSH